VAAARILGERLGLGRVETGHDLSPPRLSRGELEWAERLVAAGGEPPPKFLIAARIRRALAPGTTTPEDYREALARLGVELVWRRDDAGAIAGSTYALPGYRGRCSPASPGSAGLPDPAWRGGGMHGRCRGRGRAAGRPDGRARPGTAGGRARAAAGAGAYEGPRAAESGEAEQTGAAVARRGRTEAGSTDPGEARYCEGRAG